MFWNNWNEKRQQKRMEEFELLELRNRVYALIVAIDRDLTENAIKNGIELRAGSKIPNPWADDLALAREMEKSIRSLDSRSFNSKYGADLADLEMNYRIN